MTSGAKQLLDLLAAKHHKDVFVSEAKTGSSWDGAKRLDAWVLKSSWSPVTTIGYEIKVSRSDFLRDKKWIEYLPHCHYFSFVCPYGMIKREELPDNIGLIYLAKSGESLYTRRRAKRMPIEFDPSILIYALMSRAQIVSPTVKATGSRESRLKWWRGWLDGSVNSRTLGRAVGAKIARQMAKKNERIKELKYENRKLGALLSDD